MVYTTLNKIHTLGSRQVEWEKLLQALNKSHPDDEKISLVQLLKISGLHFTLGCCQLIPEFDKHWRLYAVWCARQVVWSRQNNKEHLFAIAVAERFANGQATQAEFEEAQALMAYPAMSCTEGNPGMTAAATTHKIAGLAAQIAAASASAGVAHYAGLKARLALPLTGNEMADIGNHAEAYDSAWREARVLAHKAQEREFIRVVTALR